MTRTYTISRAELRKRNLKAADRTTTGSKPEVRETKHLARVLRQLNADK